MLRLLFAGLTLDRCLLLLLAAWNLMLQPRRRHSSTPLEVDTELALGSSASTIVAPSHGATTTACHTEQLNCNAHSISGATGRRMLRELKASRKERHPDCTQHMPALTAHSALAPSYGWNQTTASLRGGLPDEQASLPGAAASVTAGPDHGWKQASPPCRPFRNIRMKRSKRSWQQFQPQPSSDSGEGDLQNLAWPKAPVVMQMQSSPSSGEASDAEREGLESFAGCFVRRAPAGTSTESAAAVPMAATTTSRRSRHQRTLTATSQESGSQTYPHSPQSSQAAAPVKGGASAAAPRRVPKRHSSAARRHVLSQQQRVTPAESGGGSASGGNSSRHR